MAQSTLSYLLFIDIFHNVFQLSNVVTQTTYHGLTMTSIKCEAKSQNFIQSDQINRLILLLMSLVDVLILLVARYRLITF